MGKRIMAILALMAVLAVTKGQEVWKLKLDREGIRIFSKRVPGSGLDALKIECYLEATPAQLVAVIMDVPASLEWVYNTKSIALVKQISPSELIYYSEVDVPWPVSNRDFVAHLKAVQDAKTKIVTVTADNYSSMVPVKKNVVRVTQSLAQWVIKPAGKNVVFVEYTLMADPGGSIPAWLANIVATKAPFESFKKLKIQLRRPIYRNVQLAFIENPR